MSHLVFLILALQVPFLVSSSVVMFWAHLKSPTHRYLPVRRRLARWPWPHSDHVGTGAVIGRNHLLWHWEGGAMEFAPILSVVCTQRNRAGVQPSTLTQLFCNFKLCSHIYVIILKWFTLTVWGTHKMIRFPLSYSSMFLIHLSQLVFSPVSFKMRLQWMMGYGVYLISPQCRLHSHNLKTRCHWSSETLQMERGRTFKPVSSSSVIFYKKVNKSNTPDRTARGQTS